MQIVFRTRQLQRNYEEFSRGSQQWGPIVGQRYVNCIDYLESARDLQEVYSFRSLRLHPLRGSRTGELSIYLTGRWRLIVTSGDTAQSVVIEEVSNHYDD